MWGWGRVDGGKEDKDRKESKSEKNSLLALFPMSFPDTFFNITLKSRAQEFAFAPETSASAKCIFLFHLPLLGLASIQPHSAPHVINTQKPLWVTFLAKVEFFMWRLEAKRRGGKNVFILSLSCALVKSVFDVSSGGRKENMRKSIFWGKKHDRGACLDSKFRLDGGWVCLKVLVKWLRWLLLKMLHQSVLRKFLKTLTGSSILAPLRSPSTSYPQQQHFCNKNFFHHNLIGSQDFTQNVRNLQLPSRNFLTAPCYRYSSS